MSKTKSTFAFSVLFLFFCCFPSLSYAFANEPDGFRGLVWGQSFDSVKDQMVYSHKDASFGGTDIYTRVNDELIIGSAKLQKIEYAFWQGKLMSANIDVIGSNNWAGLRDATFQRFGTGNQNNRYIEKYYWAGNTTKMLLSYNEIAKTGFLYIVSTDVSDEAKAWEKKKAQEGAQRGF